MSIANQLIEQGREQGIELGAQRGESTILIHLLECKFGALPLKYREHINQADTKQLLAWTSQALKKKDISELFAPVVQTIS